MKYTISVGGGSPPSTAPYAPLKVKLILFNFIFSIAPDHKKVITVPIEQVYTLLF